MLFTKNFMRSWINHLSNRDGYLHKIAQQTVSSVFVFKFLNLTLVRPLKYRVLSNKILTWDSA